MRMRAPMSVLGAVVLATMACNGVRLHEGRTLARALEHFSGASPSDRGRALGTLEAVTTTDARVGSAKAQCVAYARRLHEALTLKDEVAVRFGDVRSGLLEKSDPIAISLPTKLDRAEAALKEAGSLHRECRRLLAEVGAP